MSVGKSVVEEAWRADRPFLLNLAFGMLSDIGAAEDAVQEAFARLTVADAAAIDDRRAWLIVVTSRICLDQIGSARARRERAHDTVTLETAARRAGTAADPADRVTLDDEVSTALLVVLERLTPAERVVFVLHDVFATPFDEIATTVGKPAATCRQLARRARLKIHQEAQQEVRQERDRPTTSVDIVGHRRLTDKFIDACSAGDVSALLPLLDPEVWGDVDLGPLDPRSGATNQGEAKVSRNLMFWMGHRQIVCNPLSATPELLVYAHRELYAVIQLTVADSVVSAIHVIADPAKLAAVSASFA